MTACRQILPRKQEEFKLPVKTAILLFFCLLLAVHLLPVCFQDFLSLALLQQSFQTFKHLSTEHFLISVLCFLVLRFFFSVVSIPGTGVLTVAGGALFGLWLGSFLTATAVSGGLLVTFLFSRYAFQDLVRSRAGNYLDYIDKGTDKFGGGFLFMLRLVEVAPSFLINTAFGLTTMKAWTYFWVSLAGVLPGIVIFANAGTRLAELENLSGLMDPLLLASLAALGLLVVFSKPILMYLKNKVSPEN